MLKSKRSRIIALVLAVIIALSAVVGTTLALGNKSPKEVRLVQPNTYNAIAPGMEHPATGNNVATASANDPSLVTSIAASGSGIGARVTTKIAANAPAKVLGISRGTRAGTTLPAFLYQIVNPNGIAGYDLPNGGNGFTTATSGSIMSELAKIQYYKLGNATGASNEATGIAAGAYAGFTPSGTNVVTWTSLNPEVVNSSMTIVSRGTTVLLGSFTDRWGVKQTITYLFGAGMEPGKADTELNALLDAIARGQEIINNPSGYDAGDVNALRGLINNALDDIENGREINYPSDTKDINDKVDKMLGINQPGGDLITINPPLTFVPSYPNGTKLRPLTSPKNVYEVLTPGGDHQTPDPEYIYDPNGNLGKNPPVWDNKVVTAYQDEDTGTYYTKTTPPGNIFTPIKPNGTLDTDHPIWGGNNGEPGGYDDRPAAKNPDNDKWYAEEPAGSNLWKPLNTGNNTLLDTAGWVGGGADKKPGGGDDLKPIIDKNGQIVAGPFNDGTNEYYVGMKDGKFDTSGGSDGKPLNGIVHTDDQKLYDNGSGGWSITPPGPAVTAPTAISTGSLPNGTTGAAYNATLASDGTAPITWSLDGGTTLPAGLTLNSNGTITGTPTGTGTSNFTVKAANSAGSTTKAMSIIVDAAAPSVTITGFMANNGYLKADLSNATLSGKILVMDEGTGDESWVTYDAATHGGTLTWTLTPAGQSATLTANKFLKTTTTVLGTVITVKGTLVVGGNTYNSTGSWIVINSDGSVGGGAENEPIGVKGRELSTSITKDTCAWYEIARTVVDGQSFSLILRDKKISDGAWTSSQNTINTWWANNDKIPMTSPLRRYTYKPTLPAGQYGTNDGGQANNHHNGIDGSGFFSNGWSAPNPSQQVVAENNTAFLLSYAEAAKLCSTQHYNNGVSANVGSCDVAQYNWGRLSDRTSADWWLRSPGTGSGYASLVLFTGVLHGNYTGGTNALRPALWVSSDIFNQ